jgi:ribosomal-protein-alanine N-acetyltransferase
MRNEQPFPALTTERLELRAVTSGGRGSYHAVLGIAGVTRFSDVPDAATTIRAGRIAAWMPKLFPSGKGCAWLIAERRTGASVGAVRINDINERWRWNDIGYESHPDFWGRGFMPRRSARLLLADTTISN